MVGPGDAAARVGSVVGGKYFLASLLGVGGMGAVYAAENTWTKRPVALKLLHPEFAGAREVAERFMQEAQLASQLRHPNIVDVLDLGQDAADGSLFIVQELLQGNDLRTLLDASGRLDVRTAIDIALPLMGALALAHRRGVVHRDIKPENVFLATDDAGELCPKLIDFGISKVTTGRDDRNLTQAGTLVGTPNYMSPEQARGEAHLDGQTDVWSLGVVLYEMLSGRVPFDAPNQNVLMVKIIMEAAPRIEGVAPDLPASLAQVVHAALASDRAARFPDMASFAAALVRSTEAPAACLERHRRSLPSEVASMDVGLPPPVALPPTPSVSPPSAPPNPTPSPSARGTPLEWAQQRPQDAPPPPPRIGRAVALAGAVTLALAAAAGFAWMRRPAAAPSTAATATRPAQRPTEEPPAAPATTAAPRSVEAPPSEGPVAAPPPTPPPARPRTVAARSAAPPARAAPARARPVPPRPSSNEASRNGAPILSP